MPSPIKKSEPQLSTDHQIKSNQEGNSEPDIKSKDLLFEKSDIRLILNPDVLPPNFSEYLHDQIEIFCEKPVHRIYVPILQELKVNAGNQFYAENGMILGIGLNRKNLEILPESIGKLNSLLYLALNNNQLRELPESLMQLSSLVTLDLSHNQIQNLPEDWSQFKNLTTLQLDHNPLQRIPPSFQDLISLRELRIDSHQLLHIGHILPLASLNPKLQLHVINE